MSRRAKVLLYAGAELGRYGFGAGHPFSPARLAAFTGRAVQEGLAARCLLPPTVTAAEELIGLFHERAHIELVKERSAHPAGFLDGGDTPAFFGCYEAAAAVVGSAADAARRMARGEAQRAFVPIAGLHHATRDGAAGFCIFNDCGVVIELARQELGIRKVAYVDIDAHHGDGVFYAFEGDPELCFADIHQDGRTLYPGTGFSDETGTGSALGTKLNIGVPPMADDRIFAAAWERVEAHVRAAEPELIVLQCGADSVAGDPLTAMRFSASAHATAARRLCALADELGHGRVLALGGGGYNLDNCAKAWAGVLGALLGDP
jgi:acetoin utilization protein AcuC